MIVGTARLVSGRRQQLQAVLAHSSEAVRRRSWLEGSAAQNLGALLLDGFRRRYHLFLALHRARSGEYHELPRTDLYFRVAYLDYSVFRVKLLAGELVRLGYPHHLANPVHPHQLVLELGWDLTDHADDRALDALKPVGRRPRFSMCCTTASTFSPVLPVLIMIIN